MSRAWSNWSGSQQYQVASVAEPADEAEIAVIVRKALEKNQTLRAVGAAHSFNPFWTDDTILSLERMKGMVNVDQASHTLTFKAGTRLFEIGAPAWQAGYSMINMGDIDRQSLAGALSTGTHGTGVTLRNLSASITGLRLINGLGEIVALDADTDPDCLRAARVSLGSLGVITRVSLRVMPAYYLHEKTWIASVAAVEAQLASLIHENRHFEFFWDPQSDQCAVKTLNIGQASVAQSLPDGERAGRNYHLLPSERNQRFNEMEFSVPEASGWVCFMALRSMIKARFPDLRWPLEYRTLEADDSWLSTASARPSVTISVHEGASRDYKPLFLAAEDIFRGFDGRPHWGKVHFHSGRDLARLYPQWEAFHAIRSQFDPEGVFLNNYLRELFGTS